MTLIFAANSIGDPKDIPIRSLEALREADLIIFEEDRVARQTLKAAGIHRSYLKFNEHDRTLPEDISEALLADQAVVYMSDQGLPNIADPGHRLLSFAYQNGIRIQVIPGPSSISTALAAFPEKMNAYHYAGFLDREEKTRRQQLAHLKTLKIPTVLLDTPYRLEALLRDCLQVFGSQRKALLAIDLTGPNEDFIFESLKNLELYAHGKKLNFVLILAP